MDKPLPGVRQGDRKDDCRNCQRRGLRCSQNRPACDECLRSGLNCRGRPLRGGPGVWRSANRPNVQATRLVQGSPTTSTRTVPIHHAASQNVERVLPTSSAELTHSASTPMPAMLDLTGSRNRIQSSWLFDHYTHRPVLQSLLKESLNQGYGAAGSSAAAAISTTLFSKFYNLPLWPYVKPVQTPYCREYASAVQALSKEISHFKIASLEDVVVPVLLLFISEVWLTGQSREHYSGLEQIVRISGESLFREGRFDLFREVRSTMVWYAMSRGEKTLFAEEWWKLAPFILTRSLKRPLDVLVDCMADIAALLADAKASGLQVGQNPETEFDCRARGVLHTLFSWRWSWHARNPDGVLEKPASNTEPFGTALNYSQPSLLYEIWLCDALVLLMLAFPDPPNIQRSHTVSTPQTGKLWRPSGSLTVHEVAVEICRSLDYQLDHLAAPTSPHQWAMPLALAYVSLSSTDPIAMWVLVKINAAPDSRRIPWLCYIECLQGKDQDAASDLFACWPIIRRDTRHEWAGVNCS